jgi:hypothetical protein
VKLETSLHRFYKTKHDEGEWYFLDDSDVSNFTILCEQIEKAFDVIKDNNPYY